MNNNMNIVVTGDVTIDWNICRPERPKKNRIFQSNKDIRYFQKKPHMILPAYGGAALLADLINNIGKKLKKVTKQQIKVIPPKLEGVSKVIHNNNGKNNIYQFYHLCAPYKNSKDKDGEKEIWRLNEFLGSNVPVAITSTDVGNRPKIQNNTTDVQIVVLDDKDLGFNSFDKLWPQSIKNGSSPYIVLRTKKPTDSKLWDKIIKKHSERTITIVTASDLHNIGISFSEKTSWDRTVKDLIKSTNRELREMTDNTYVVISFDYDGAIFLYKSNGQINCKAFFNPIEGSFKWQNDHGQMNGNTYCLTAAITRELIKGDTSDIRNNISDGILLGLHTMQEFFNRGYIVKETNETILLDFPTTDLADFIVNNSSSDFRVDEFKGELTINKICKKMLSDGYNLNMKSKQNTLVWLNDVLNIPDLYDKITKKISQPPSLSIKELKEKYNSTKNNADLKKLNRLTLEEYYPKITPKSPNNTQYKQADLKGLNNKTSILEKQSERLTLPKLAFNIVEKGTIDTLQEKNIPFAKFKDLIVADPLEIEGLNIISGLIEEYSKSLSEQPLSIAVFGQPGSGKSFGIKQVAAKLDEDIYKDLTFNLSQFSKPEELHGAFHQIRDLRLKDKIPIVIWDEFDAKLEANRLGWLRYFLAPMQDGTFLEGQVTHPIGKSIFVFAGGTSCSMKEFQEKIKKKEPMKKKILKKPNSKIDDEIKDIKGTDFASRLKGYVDISGPNGRDKLFIIRRAILLRAFFERHCEHLIREANEKGVIIKKKMHIEKSLLEAFLHKNTQYLHGARSMEAIVLMSRFTNKGKFDVSSLPSVSQMKLHLEDASKFIEIAKKSL